MLGAHSSQHSSRQRRRDHGFTLVELITVVTIVGVLAALAGPPFFEFIVKQRLRNAAYELIADLTFARSEAVKRNASVTVAKSGTWAGGWTVKDAGGATLREHPAFSDTLSISMGSSSLAFNRDGRASATASFTIDDSGGKTSISPRYVCVDQSGRPRSTDASCT